MSREFVTSVDISESHRIAVLIEVLRSGEVQEEILAVQGPRNVVLEGAVTKDAAAASRSRLSLTLVGTEATIVTSPASLLAPYATELRVARGVRVGDDEQLVYQGVFPIDRTTDTDSGHRVQVACLDRSGRFAEAKFETDGSIASGTNAGTAILSVLQEVDPDLDYNATEFDSITVDLPELIWNEGDDRWALALGIAKAIGAELYHDGTGQLRIGPVPSAVAGNPAATIAEGPGGVLLGAERDWDRGPVVNRWKVTGENPDNAEVVPVGLAIDDNPDSPTYYYGEFGRKPSSYHNSFISTDDQAADCAAGLLARSIGEPDRISFESVVDPGRFPSDVVRVTRARLGIDEDHVLDSVSCPLSYNATMAATTRAAQVFS